MNLASAFLAHRAKKLSAACALALVLVSLFAVTLAPQLAYADSPTYTMSVRGSDASDNIAPGDTFTLSLSLANNEDSQYTMYAMSATVRYDSSMIEVTDMNTSNGIDIYTADAGNGWTQVVLNFKARTLRGTTWDNDTPLMNVTFKALEQGSTSVRITRANISNSTGMGSYACTCNDAVVTVSTSGNGQGVAPSDDVSEGTTSGVEAPEADDSTLSGDTEMTDAEKAEYEASRAGEAPEVSEAPEASETPDGGSSDSAASSSSSASKASSGLSLSTDESSSASDESFTVLWVLVGVFAAAVLILIAGIVVHKRRRK